MFYKEYSLQQPATAATNNNNANYRNNSTRASKHNHHDTPTTNKHHRHLLLPFFFCWKLATERLPERGTAGLTPISQGWKCVAGAGTWGLGQSILRLVAGKTS
jgi:hypothetical protein